MFNRSIERIRQVVKREKEKKIIVDFSYWVNAKYKVANNHKHTKIVANNKVCFLEVREARHRRNRCKRIEEISVNGWSKRIGEMTPSKAMTFYDLFSAVIEASNGKIIVPFIVEMLNGISNRTEVTATNVSVKDSNIGGCWIISCKNKSFKKRMCCTTRNGLTIVQE